MKRQSLCGRALSWIGIGFLMAVLFSSQAAGQTSRPALTQGAGLPAWTGEGGLARWSWRSGDFVLWLSGQYRLRMEFMQGRDLRAPDEAPELPKDRLFLVQRARLTMGSELWKHLEFYVQLQDVRVFGEEKDTIDFQAEGFDLHQGWVKIKPTEGLFLQAGRMELSYDNERIMGSLDWLQQGRSFDGVRVGWEPKAAQIHAFYAAIQERGTMLIGSHLSGLWGKLRLWPAFQPSLLYLFEYDQAVERFRHTLGTHLLGKIGGFQYSGEFYLQMGSQKVDQTTTSIFSYLAALSVGYTLPVPTAPTFQAWAEVLSGTDSSQDKVIRSFDTLYATNHKFYGYLDMFLNLPVHTKQRGLMDFGGSFRLSPAPGLSLLLAYHYFRLFAPALDAQQTPQQELGSEIDIVLSYTLLKGYLILTAGHSTLIPREAFAAIGKGKQIEQWFFFEIHARF